MRLLISNDDGVFAEGIQCLANTLARAGYEVTVVCPDRERSATGHGLTLHDPIRAEPVTGIFDPSIKVWACSGTPADCVKLALGALVKVAPSRPAKPAVCLTPSMLSSWSVASRIT